MGCVEEPLRKNPSILPRCVTAVRQLPAVRLDGRNDRVNNLPANKTSSIPCWCDFRANATDRLSPSVKL